MSPCEDIDDEGERNHMAVCTCRIVGPITAISRNLTAYRDIGDETYAIQFCPMHAAVSRLLALVKSAVEPGEEDEDDVVVFLERLQREGEAIMKEIEP